MANTNTPIQFEARQHYYLVAGEIFYQTPDDEQMGAMRLNCVVMSKDGRLSVAHIGRAQQALQAQFFRMIGNTNPNIVNVVIIAFNPLGEFTNAEFNAPPEGTKLAELVEATHGAGNA